MASVPESQVINAGYCFAGFDYDEAANDADDYGDTENVVAFPGFDGIEGIAKPTVPKPVAPEPNGDNIPEYLKARKQWVCWAYEWKEPKDGNEGKWTKVPKQTRGARNAQSNNPDTWTSFESVLNAYHAGRATGKFDGIGFCFAEGDGLAGIDLDHCLDRATGGILKPEAQAILDKFAGSAYVERSPGGDGLRLYVLGQHPRSGKAKGDMSWIEAYCYPSNRFLTVTGNVIEGGSQEPQEAQSAFDWLNETFTIGGGKQSSKSERASKTGQAQAGTVVEDDDLIQRIRQSKGKEKFSALFDDGQHINFETGEVLGDHSSADMALCAILAWWTVRNAEQMDRIFRRSALLRDKWDERHYSNGETYGAHTIQQAIELNLKNGGEAYTGQGNPAELEELRGEATRRIPKDIQTAIWATAQDCGVDVKDPKWQEAFAGLTDFCPVRLMNVIDACMYRQESSKFIVLTGQGEYRVFAKGDLKAGLDGSFPPFINTVKLRQTAESYADGRCQNQKEQAAHVIRCLGRIGGAVQNHILVNKQFSAVTLKVDMFAEKAATRLADGVAHLTLPHIPFEEGPIQQAVIDDFKAHWPMFDEFLDLLVASRFAAARKKSYVWLKADSDWGKGLLQGVLEELGLVVSLSVREVETLMGGGPVGKMMADFKRAWIVWFNEFKTVKSELKMLEQNISFAPKNLPQVKAEVFLKIFTSAEAVEALASHDTGVEDQFANRFSAIECTGSIEDRSLFMASKLAYRSALAAYVAKRLNVLVEIYRLMGREAAANQGDEVISAFHSKHGIGNRYARLSSALPELARQHLEWVGQTYLAADLAYQNHSKRGLSAVEKEIHSAVLRKEENGSDQIYIRAPTKILDLWLESEFGAAAGGKLKWKSADFKTILPEPSPVRFREAGVQKVRLIGTIETGDARAQTREDEEGGVRFMPAQ